MEQAASVREMDLRQGSATITAEGRVRAKRRPGLRRPRVQVSTESNLQGGPPAPVFAPSQASAVAELLMRLLDLAGSLLLLLFALPLMLFSAMLIKLTSSGPALYKQQRVGKGGKLFTLYKFRTMVPDAEKHVGPVWATRDDDRVTPVGRVFRKLRVDELPQLYNVLRGDMSLVGPRPERPFFVERHRALQGVRLSVKPGLTGLAQVRAFYDLKPDHKLKYDYLYIQKRSPLLNAYILLRTIPALFTRMGW